MKTTTSFTALATLASAFLGLVNAGPLMKRANPGKKGLSFNVVATTQPFGQSASWAYNWAFKKDGNLPQGVDYIPMLFNLDANHAPGWNESASAAIAAGTTHLLGFNEPDLPAQGNLSPADAAAGWRANMQQFAGRAKLVSPAVTNGAPPNLGLGWLDQFLDLCKDCTIDVIAIHIYDSSTNLEYYKKYITDVGTKYKKPVWVTEFGAPEGTPEQQATFVTEMTKFLDGLPSVERYAHFAALEGKMVTGGQLNGIGQAYVK